MVESPRRLALIASLFCIVVVCGPTFLGLSTHFLFNGLWQVSSSSGSTAMYCESAGWDGHTVYLRVYDFGQWTTVGPVDSDNSGVECGGTYWTADGMVIVSDIRGTGVRHWIAYDFSRHKQISDRDEIARLVKAHRGKGPLIAASYQELTASMRHPWWWELSLLGDGPDD